MAEANLGKALYAVHQGVYVIKLVGEIRVPICATLDHFLETMFTCPDLRSVLIDLSDTQVIDSTALGLLAKVAIKSKKDSHGKPNIISTRPDVTRVLDTMGFQQVFNIAGNQAVNNHKMTELPEVCCDEQVACRKALEAHRVLMDMNAHNRKVFREVVSVLENASNELSCGETHTDLSDTKTHQINPY